MARNYKQGIYEVQNWEKYKGTKMPRYLSNFELVFFSWADRSPNVLEWSAECFVVKYFNPVKNRMARYIVDVYMKYKTVNGEIREALIEIKPENQTHPPKKGNKSNKSYAEAYATWLINEAKWQEAQKYAKDRGWEFRIITENQLFRG